MVFIGCGSSYCLAKSAARMMLMHGGKPAFAFTAGDVMLHPDSYRSVFDNAAVVTISRSGSTSEVVYALDAMRTRSAFDALTINCVADSLLSERGAVAIDMPWAFDKSVCQTRCVSCLYYTVASLAAMVGNKPDIITELARAAGSLSAFIRDNEEAFGRIASGSWTNAVVLADAEISGLSEEGALAYREICQVPGVFFNVLDCRHGPMVLFDAETLVVVQLTGDGEHERKLAEDAVAKGCRVVAVSDTPITLDGATVIVTGATGGQVARGVYFILVNQFISLRKAAVTGADPDKPDGLLPWIKL
ncbi:MAG: SIS domain-containing protein [Planctomycetes bacterium]|nr:SIS domain-containing protein [Planctomycetota bacterium]